MRGGQCLLASPRFSIFGNLSKCSGSSILNESLNSRLCLRNTRLSFFEVERMPVIRSCEFYVFSREGLAVSTFLWSSEPARTAASRLPFSKEGVRMVRLSGSSGVRGEASQRQMAWWLKKSGGSLELRMRMFLRRERLLLRQWGSSSELSMQNYMLEIQLFDQRMHPAQCSELQAGYISIFDRYKMRKLQEQGGKSFMLIPFSSVTFVALCQELDQLALLPRIITTLKRTVLYAFNKNCLTVY